MTFVEAITALIEAPAWSMKVARKSDNQIAMIKDFTGQFVLGPQNNNCKDRFCQRLYLDENLFQADNYEIIETDCKWVE